MNGKWYDGFKTIEFKGAKYVVLEGIYGLQDEDGEDCGMGIAHAVDVAAGRRRRNWDIGRTGRQVGWRMMVGIGG